MSNNAGEYNKPHQTVKFNRILSELREVISETPSRIAYIKIKELRRQGLSFRAISVWMKDNGVPVSAQYIKKLYGRYSNE